MTVNCRCTLRRSCGKRKTLARHPDSYRVYPKCPMAGCKGHLNADPSPAAQTQRRTCHCGHIRYPHKRGAFINANEICEHALVEDLGDEPVKVKQMQPDEECPF